MVSFCFASPTNFKSASLTEFFLWGIVAMELAEVPGLSVRIIPTATSLFSILKLNLKRNNVCSLKQGCMLSSIQAWF